MNGFKDNTINISQIAREVTELLRAGKFGDEIAAFYSDTIVSIEPEGQFAETHGRAAVAAKVQAWFDEYTVQAIATTGPFVNGDRILIGLDITMTARTDGQTLVFQEFALYTVADEQIVEERFFY